MGVDKSFCSLNIFLFDDINSLIVFIQYQYYYHKSRLFPFANNPIDNNLWDISGMISGDKISILFPLCTVAS